MSYKPPSQREIPAEDERLPRVIQGRPTTHPRTHYLHCDGQCRNDSGIHMKPNTNKEEAGRIRFRLIEMSARREKIGMTIITSPASVSYICKSWSLPIRGAINAKSKIVPRVEVPGPEVAETKFAPRSRMV